MNHQSESLNHNAPQPAVFSTAKRLACERCRHQKLRCPPRDQPTEPCSRCARLGTHCVTGYPRPHGRTIRKGSLTRGRTSSRPELRLRPSTSLIQTILPECGKLAPTLSSEISLQDSLCHDGSPQLSIISSQEQETVFTPFVEAAFKCDMPHFHRAQNGDIGDGFWPNYQDLYKFDDLPAINTTSNNTEGELDTLGMGDDSSQSSCSSATPNPFASSWEYDQRLSQLNLSCSTRLENSLDITETSKSGAISSDLNNMSYEEGSWSETNLGELLRDMSEFISIVQSYKRAESARPYLGTVIQLNILSIYLQFVAISDKLMQCLCMQFNPSNPLCIQVGLSGAEGPQPLPGLHLAGFQVQQGSLQASLLLHTMEHQFSTMERLLGLPSEWQVVGKQKVHTGGLLGNEKGRLILDAVTIGNGGPARGDLFTVASLRNSIYTFRRHINQ